MFYPKRLKQVHGLNKCADNYCEKLVDKFYKLCDQCMRKHRFNSREEASDAMKWDTHRWEKFNRHIAHLNDRTIHNS